MAPAMCWSTPSLFARAVPRPCASALCVAFVLALCHALPAGADLVDYDYDPDALPKPVLDGREDWIRLYYAAWDFAADNINFATPGSGFVAEYMDEALTDNKVWQWDTLFIAMFAKYANGELPIMDGVDNFYRKQRSDGFICRELNEKNGTDIYPNSSQPWDIPNPNPPLYSWAEWDYYRVTGDASRFTRVVASNRDDEPPQAKTIFRRMVDYHFWIKRNIRHADGHYRSDFWANGMDDSPRNDINTTDANEGAWMDLAAQQALAALYLAKIAAVVGDEDARRSMLEEHRHHKDLVNDAYWHEGDKLYYDRDEHREIYKTKTVATFWPLIAEVASRYQADHLVHHLVDFGEFWRPTLVPTLAADQPAYSVTGEYWQGASWPPTTYMTTRGLTAYGYWPLARAVAENYVHALSLLYERTGTIWENNAPEIIAPSTDSIPHFVGWGGLGPIAMLIEHVIGIELNAPDGTIEWRLGQPARNGIENLAYNGGRIARMISAPRADPSAPATITIQSTVPFALTVWIGNRSFTRNIAAGAERTYRFGHDNHAPTPNPNGPYRFRPGRAVAYSSAGSSDPDGRIVGYHWDFGDGGSSTEPNPTHVYAAPGAYRVTLTATDDDGATASARTLSSVGEDKPVAAFYGDKIRLKHGGRVRFRDQSTNSPTRWRWEFPGGTPPTSDERNPVVQYSTAGEYDVSLQVGNAYGSSEKSYVRYVDVLGDLPKDYCWTGPSNDHYTYISGISFGALANRTSSDRYSLWPERIRIAPGSTPTLRLVADVVTPVNNDRNAARAWVDWNGNRIFEAEELVMDRRLIIADQPVSVTQQFAIPDEATGLRRMRVKLNYDDGNPVADFGPCLGFASGEVEDFDLWVVGEPPSPRLSLWSGDQTTLDMRSLFPDELEDPQAYTAVSDNERLATVEIEDGRLRIATSAAGGVVNVAVTAIFEDGREAVFHIMLTIEVEQPRFMRGWRIPWLDDA